MYLKKSWVLLFIPIQELLETRDTYYTLVKMDQLAQQGQCSYVQHYKHTPLELHYPQFHCIGDNVDLAVSPPPLSMKNMSLDQNNVKSLGPN